MLHSLQCKKSPLSKNETHFLHQNGSLYVGDSRYDTHEYCVENTKIGSTIEVNENLKMKKIIYLNSYASIEYFVFYFFSFGHLYVWAIKIRRNFLIIQLV